MAINGPVRVLVVEDDPDDAILTQSFLDESKDVEFETEVATTPTQALTMMEGGQHDVCLLDYMLGMTDGFALFAEAKANGYKRPVILMTGQSSAGVADVALEAGFSDFLEKSRVDGAILERTIRYSLERKQTELEILALNETLDRRIQERTEELVAINLQLEGFTYTVAHDLRGPLRAIVSTSHILIEDYSRHLDATGIALLERQSSAAKKVATLIDDLLRMSKLSRKEMVWSRVDLSSLANEIGNEVLAGGWPQPLRIEVEEGMHSQGDRGLLTSVFRNLLENACKFSPDGGTISVGVRLARDESVYFIKDEGIGFDMRYAKKIFMPFERLVLEAQFPGTGIGLANVERVIQRHGGRIWVESVMGTGTTFFFTLST